MPTYYTPQEDSYHHAYGLIDREHIFDNDFAAQEALSKWGAPEGAPEAYRMDQDGTTKIYILHGGIRIPPTSFHTVIQRRSHQYI